MPHLLSVLLTKRINEKTALEKALKDSGTTLPHGKKPTCRDIFLLSEMLKHLNHGKNGWRALDLTSRVNEIKNQLKEHFPTLHLEGMRLMKEKSIYIKIKRLLEPFNRLFEKLNNKQRRLLSKENLEAEFIFYEKVPELVPVEPAEIESICPEPTLPQIEHTDKTDPLWQPTTDRNIQGLNDKETQTDAKFFRSNIKDRNTLSFEHTAAACEKIGIGNKAAATLINAVLRDLKFVTEDNPCHLVDQFKIERERQKCRQKATERLKQKFEQSPPVGIYFDAKDILTCKEFVDNEGHKKRRKVKVHQYVLTSAEGEFIESFEYIKEKASNSETHARKVAKKLYEICEQWDILDNLFIIGADTTPTNTGWKGGIFYFFEQRLGRRLFRVECQLHINELPLRAIIENVIGERSCKTKLNGEIGDRLLLATELSSTEEIRVIATDEVVEIPEDIVSELSNDQKYGYHIYRAIATGSIEHWEKIVNSSVGPLNKCRWLTTACRFCRLWISDKESRNFDDEEEKKLEIVVGFIIKVYFPCWFQIKKNFQFSHGPENLLKYLHLLKTWERSEELTEIVSNSLSNNSYYAASDKILLYMMSSELQADRERACNIVLQMRGEKEFGYKSPDINKITYGEGQQRSRKPVVNQDATCVLEMIPLSNFKFEPLFTADLTRDQITNIIEKKLELPKVEGFTQNVERIIRRAVEASALYWNHETRDAHMRAQQNFSRTYPTQLISKVAYLPMLKKAKSI